MPDIRVVADTVNGGDTVVFLAERITPVQLDDAHLATQLVERVKWAGEDAERGRRGRRARRARGEHALAEDASPRGERQLA